MPDAALPGLPELHLPDFVLVEREQLAGWLQDRVNDAVARTRREYDTGLMTAQEVAEELAVSRSTITHLVAHGDLRVTRIGKALRFRREDVAEYVKANTVEIVTIPERRMLSDDEARRYLERLKREHGA